MEEVIREVMREVRRRLDARSVEGQRERQRAEFGRQADQLRREILRLGEAIVSTEEPPRALARMMGEREDTLAAVEKRIVALRRAPAIVDLGALLEKEVRVRLTELRGLAQRDPGGAGRALEALLVGPLVIRTEKSRLSSAGSS